MSGEQGRPVTVTPNGCRWCGLPEREHYRQWKQPVGWHGWTTPTDDQRKERMLARRAAARTEKRETVTDKITTVFDNQDRMWTYAVGCWGNDDMQVRFDTLEQLSRRYGSLYDSVGAEVDVSTVADPGVVDLEETCGDCVEGRCHWGGDEPLPGEECGCERHDASVRARSREGSRSSTC